MEMIVRPCLRANGISSGSRSIRPSSPAISTMAPAGRRPASRARSTAASVWPLRTRTPPGLARSGKMWPGRTKSPASASPLGQQLERGGAVGGGDAGGHAVGGARVDGDREGRAHRLGVVLDHLRELEAVELVALHGRADQAAALAHHEGDDLGGRLLGGDDEVALVLPVLVVDDHDRAARRDVRDGLLDRVEREVRGVLIVSRAVPNRRRGHAGAPSRRGCPALRERSHQSRMPHRTSAP